MSTESPIKTARVQGRRVLHFDSIDDALADVQQLAISERQGKVKCLGNWTAGQTLGHLATWAEYAYDEMPKRVPFFVRWLMKPLKNRVLNEPMRAGAKLPRTPGGTLGTDAVPFEEGLDRFCKSFTRLKGERPTQPNALFGELTQEEWIKLQLRHAELHLSFLRCD